MEVHMPPRQPEATRAVYVRLPLRAAEKLDRAAAERGASKRDVIASLLDAHVGSEASPRRVIVEDGADGLTLGHARFTPAAADAVLTLEEAADLLRVPVEDVRGLAESGELPARRLGDAWRFRRDALLAWLGGGAIS
jgi:excisionase family DNA binding protein